MMDVLSIQTWELEATLELHREWYELEVRRTRCMTTLDAVDLPNVASLVRMVTYYRFRRGRSVGSAGGCRIINASGRMPASMPFQVTGAAMGWPALARGE
jgi:hypothetical protein